MGLSTQSGATHRCASSAPASVSQSWRRSERAIVASTSCASIRSTHATPPPSRSFVLRWQHSCLQDRLTLPGNSAFEHVARRVVPCRWIKHLDDAIQQWIKKVAAHFNTPKNPTRHDSGLGRVPGSKTKKAQSQPLPGHLPVHAPPAMNGTVEEPILVLSPPRGPPPLLDPSDLVTTQGAMPSCQNTPLDLHAKGNPLLAFT